MNIKIGIFKEYISTFRDLINTKIRPEAADIRESLRLSKDEDWFFLCVSMDIIEDASIAINSFLQFGLNGPTKYNDEGEKYLRLYGILSATYVQQEALIKLCQIMNVPPSWKKIKKQLNKLIIRSLRHKLCSHSTNYYDESSDSIQAYVPIRCDLSDFQCTYGRDGRGNHETVDLKAAIDEHLRELGILLDKALEKAITTLFKGQESNKLCTEFKDRLEDLRTRKEGGLVLQNPDGSKLIITIGRDK